MNMDALEAEIREVTKAVVKVEVDLGMAETEDSVDYLRRKGEQLREKKIQLRAKEIQLREERLMLLKAGEGWQS